jgi:hypothetical protein
MVSLRSSEVMLSWPLPDASALTRSLAVCPELEDLTTRQGDGVVMLGLDSVVVHGSPLRRSLVGQAVAVSVRRIVAPAA